MKRAALLVMMVIASCLLSGCSLVGLGIGAAIPKTTVEDSVRVESGGKTVTLTTPEDSVSLTRHAVVLRKEHKSTYAMDGLGAGIILDVTFALLALVAYETVGRESPCLMMCHW